MKNNIIKAVIVLTVGFINTNNFSREQKVEKTINKLFVLGDSLSDTGAGVNAKTKFFQVMPNLPFKGFKMLPPFYNNSFSNDAVAAQVIANKFNFKMNPGWRINFNGNITEERGTNFAVGGQVAADKIQKDLIDQEFHLKKQVYNLLQMHQIKRNDVFFMTIGANDLFSLIGTNKGHIEEERVMDSSITNQELVIKQLITAGAENIVFTDVPDLSATPRMIRYKKTEEAKKISLRYQIKWEEMVKRLEKSFARFISPYRLSNKINTLMQEFTNDRKFLQTSATKTFQYVKNKIIFLEPKFNAGVNESNINDYFFFDEIHPGKWAHKQIGNDIANIIAKKVNAKDV